MDSLVLINYTHQILYYCILYIKNSKKSRMELMNLVIHRIFGNLVSSDYFDWLSKIYCNSKQMSIIRSAFKISKLHKIYKNHKEHRLLKGNRCFSIVKVSNLREKEVLIFI